MMMFSRLLDFNMCEIPGTTDAASMPGLIIRTIRIEAIERLASYQYPEGYVCKLASNRR